MGILIDLVLVAGLAAALASASPLLGPRRKPEGDAALPYETGMRPIESAAGRMNVLYVRYALLFVVFDVDLAFLLPAVMARQKPSLELLGGLSLFTALIGLTLAYVWRKGALECR